MLNLGHLCRSRGIVARIDGKKLALLVSRQLYPLPGPFDPCESVFFGG